MLKAIVYNQAMLAVIVCSHSEWTDRYLGGLRSKFLDQEYPEALTDGGFEKAKKQNRKDLMYKKKTLKKPTETK